MSKQREGFEGDEGLFLAEASAALGRSLDFVLKASTGVVCITMLLGSHSAPLGLRLMEAAFLGVLGLSHALLRSGRQRFAGAMLAVGFWSVATCAVFMLGGIRSPGLFVYLPVLLTAGIFWSKRAMTALATASVLVVLIAVQLDAMGALPAPIVPSSPARMWIVFAGSLFMTAVLETIALRHVALMRSELARSTALFDDLEHRFESAERLDSLGRIAGGVAHDFNNLLTVILSSAAILERQLGPDSTGVRFAREITDAGMRASALTRRLLAFGRRSALLASTDLNDAVTEMSGLLSRLVGDRHVVAVITDARFPNGRIERAELEQVILNLVANARDAMPDGGRITVRTSDERPLVANGQSARGRYVVLTVRDEGVGMTKDTQARIFEPFYTTKTQGTGLGLSTVRDIVRQNRGHIRIESAPGRGSSFSVLVPGSADSTLLLDEPAPDSAGPPNRPSDVRLSDPGSLVVSDVARKIESA